jgi:antitoxin ParD1/3/4
MARMTISMPDAMSDFINAQIETGKYDNVSEYLRDLVRHEQERREAAEDKLRQMLIEAKNSADSDDSIEDVFERVKERLLSEGKDLQA